MKFKSVALLAVVALLVAAQGAFAEDANQGQKKKRRGVVGKVKSVDAEKSTITLTVRSKDKKSGERTIKVAEKAKISVNGKPAKLGDIKEGAVARVRLGENDEAVAINVGRRKKKKDA